MLFGEFLQAPATITAMRLNMFTLAVLLRKALSSREAVITWHYGNAQLFRLVRSGTQALCASFFEAGVDSSVQSCFIKAGGSRERSEPWSESGRVWAALLTIHTYEARAVKMKQHRQTE